jgi:hypothetical protein
MIDIRESDMFHEFLLGGICGWSFCKHTNEWVYCLLYWTMRELRKVGSQINFCLRLMYWSGFVSRTRGRHRICVLYSGRWY